MTTYRPQFAHPPAPLGFEDEQFHYAFDGTNCPLLAATATIPAGGFSNNIVLLMEADAPFICRGIKIGLGLANSNMVDFQLKTPRGDYMQAVPVPVRLYTGRGSSINNANIGKGLDLFIPMENEVEAPAGSNWTLYLYNPTAAPAVPPIVTLFGVKRRKCSSVRRAA